MSQTLSGDRITAFGPNTPSFTVAEMTAWLLQVPMVPSLLADLRLFQAKPIATVATGIELQAGARLALVPAQPRGAPAARNVMGRRHLVPFEVPHFPLADTIMADAIQDRRALGRSELQSWAEVVAERLAVMGRHLDTTEEHLRFGACRGTVITHIDRESGEVLNAIDLFAAFNIVPPPVIDFPMAGEGARTAEAAWSGAIMSAVRRVVREMQGSLQITAPVIAGICGSAFFDSLTAAAELRQTHLGTASASTLRENSLFRPTHFGGVDFYDYGGAMVGGVPFMPADECQFAPVGIPELFVQAYSPAPYTDVVNQLGMPRYARQELLEFSKGIAIETQLNTLPLCSNPRCLLVGKLVPAGA